MHQATNPPKHKLQNSPRKSAAQLPYFSFSWQIFTFLRLEILQIFDTFRPEPSGPRLIPPLDDGRHLLLLLLPLLLLLRLLLSGPDLLSPPARLPPASGRHRGPLLQLLLPPLLPPLPPPSGVVSRAAPRVFTPSVLCRSNITCQRQMKHGIGMGMDGQLHFVNQVHLWWQFRLKTLPLTASSAATTFFSRTAVVPEEGGELRELMQAFSQLVPVEDCCGA